MKALWFFFLLQSLQIFAQPSFGTAYLPNSRMCKQWSCINTKLGLPNSLPPREQFDIALRSLLPDGEWQNVVNKVLDSCYGKRTRVYMNTCPGQALLQCTVENLINNCPESSQRINDACTPINSFAGMTHMFSQSVYTDIERSAAIDRRPRWFLKNYFNTKCCNLPPLFNSSVLADCKISSVISYYHHAPQLNNFVLFGSTKVYTTAPSSVAAVKIVNPDEIAHTTASPAGLTIPNLDVNIKNHSHEPNALREKLSFANLLHVCKTYSGSDVNINCMPKNNYGKGGQDPLDCCDMSEFIQPSWRSECDFKLSWSHETRLTVRNSSRATTVLPPTTTTAAPLILRDVKVVPVSSENLTCVFNKLDMLTGTGDVKLESFMKLLDNYTKDHEEFAKAKARVITECLTKPLLTYEGVSHIVKVVACTLDLLSENCPYYNKKSDSCRNPTAGMICQISSSRYRGKTRRTLCNLPELVPNHFLKECGISSLSHKEYVLQKITTVKKYGHIHTKIGCMDASESTTCLMKKMGVLNKYNFMDYFKMKDRIRQYPIESTMSTNTYLSAFTYPPLYSGHCNSPKKLLNVIDSMLTTCPIARRRTSHFCNEIFGVPSTEHYQHVYAPAFATTFKRPHSIYYKSKPLYNFGVLSSGAVPPVKVIDVNPTTSRPVTPVRLPVYLSLRVSPLSTYGVANSMLRGNAGSLARSYSKVD